MRGTRKPLTCGETPRRNGRTPSSCLMRSKQQYRLKTLSKYIYILRFCVWECLKGYHWRAKKNLLWAAAGQARDAPKQPSPQPPPEHPLGLGSLCHPPAVSHPIIAPCSVWPGSNPTCVRTACIGGCRHYLYLHVCTCSLIRHTCIFTASNPLLMLHMLKHG